MNLDSWTEFREETIFQLQQQHVKFLTDKHSAILRVSYEIDFHLTEIERTYYSTLDFFADVGGLQAVVFSFFYSVLAIVN